MGLRGHEPVQQSQQPVHLSMHLPQNMMGPNKADQLQAQDVSRENVGSSE